MMVEWSPTGTNNAPPLPSGDDFTTDSTPGPPSNTQAASISQVNNPVIVTPPVQEPSVTVFGTPTQPAKPVPPIDIQYEDPNHPSQAQVSFGTPQQEQPLFDWIAADTDNSYTDCPDPNSFCHLTFPGVGKTLPPRPQFSRPAPIPRPSSTTDCQVLQENWKAVLYAAKASHKRCMDHWRGSTPRPGSDQFDEFSPGSMCSFLVCQDVHNAVARIKAEMNAAYQGCIRAISGD